MTNTKKDIYFMMMFQPIF